MSAPISPSVDLPVVKPKVRPQGRGSPISSQKSDTVVTLPVVTPSEKPVRVQYSDQLKNINIHVQHEVLNQSHFYFAVASSTKRQTNKWPNDAFWMAAFPRAIHVLTRTRSGETSAR